MRPLAQAKNRGIATVSSQIGLPKVDRNLSVHLPAVMETGIAGLLGVPSFGCSQSISVNITTGFCCHSWTTICLSSGFSLCDCGAEGAMTSASSWAAAIIHLTTDGRGAMKAQVVEPVEMPDVIEVGGDGPLLVVHGGAGRRLHEMTPEQASETEAALARAVEAGYAQLAAGAPAEEAVIAAIHVMEDAPCFNCAPRCRAHARRHGCPR